MAIAQVLDRFHGGHDGLRQDGVAQAQFRQHDLGKAAHVGHDAVAVHALQGILGPAFVAEGAVVIVFDDDGAQLVRPLQQGVAARHAHGHAERELVCGRDIDQPRAVGNLFGHQAILVHGDTRHARAHAGEHGACNGIAGFLDSNRIARFQQGVRQQVQRLLRAAGDDDLFWRAMDAAAEGRMAGDGRAQGWQAGHRRIAAARLAILAQRVQHAGAPFVLREVRRRGPPADKRIARRHFLAGPAQGRGRGFPAGNARGAGQRRAGMAALRRGVRRLHETAHADLTCQQLFITELVIDVGYRLARQPQLAGQQARGRQLLAIGQPARADGLAELAVQLSAQVARAVDQDM
ncbi:hypothetical protein D3C81_730950 [compost metagenome]